MSSRKSEILHFDRLLLSKSYKVSAKKIQKSYLSWHWSLTFMTLDFGEFLSNHSKSGNFTSMGYFCPKYISFELKEYRGVIFLGTEQWCRIWINPDFVVSKMAWEIWWTFIRTLKSLKNFTSMGYFRPKHMIFQLENFKQIICHDTEGWCQI